MQSRSGRTKYKVITLGRLKDRKTGKILKSIKEKGGGKKPIFGKKAGGKMAKGYSKGGARMMRAMGGKMAKGYAKGGTKMMRAMGGKMAKGYAKGSTKMMRAKNGGLTVGMLRKVATKMGYKITKK